MQLSRETQALARHLLDYEAVAGGTSKVTESAVFRVCEKLRKPLCAVAGVAGYRSLASLALALAKSKAPSLGAVQVAADGSLLGLAEIESPIDKDQASEEGVILIAQLLGLLLTFLGESLTLRLVQDAAPHLKVTTQSGTLVPVEMISQEVSQLKDVSERLELLAEQHPSVEDGLMSISGNIRNTASVLEVLALIRNSSNGQGKRAPKQDAEHYKM
jgi:hypothetical protein